VALAVYLASYLPLSVILFVQDLQFDRLSATLCDPYISLSPDCRVPLAHPIVALTAVVVCSLALGLALGVLKLVGQGQPITIKTSKHVPADLMNYTLPYVVSLIGLDYKDPGKLLGFLVFFLWMFVITYRSGQIVLNPVLTVFGWQLYEITYAYDAGSGTERDGVVLSKVPIEASQSYRQSSVQDVFVIKPA
jgi:hypothetical protein